MGHGVDDDDLGAGLARGFDGLDVPGRAEGRVEVDDVERLRQAVGIQAAAPVLGVDHHDLLGLAAGQPVGKLERAEGLAGAGHAGQLDEQARALALCFADLECHGFLSVVVVIKKTRTRSSRGPLCRAGFP